MPTNLPHKAPMARQPWPGEGVAWIALMVLALALDSLARMIYAAGGAMHAMAVRIDPGPPL